MKTRLLGTIVLALCLASPLAYGQDDEDEHSGHHPDAAQTEAPPAGEEPAMGMGQMRRNMKRIQELMEQIRATDDSSAREELMNQHLEAMRDQIAAMRAMAGGKGMGMMGKGGGMAGAEDDGDATPQKKRKQGMRGGGMMQMHKRMEDRAGMLEMLIEQMLEREAVEADLPAER